MRHGSKKKFTFNGVEGLGVNYSIRGSMTPSVKDATPWAAWTDRSDEESETTGGLTEVKNDLVSRESNSTKRLPMQSLPADWFGLDPEKPEKRVDWTLRREQSVLIDSIGEWEIYLDPSTK